VIEEEEEVDKIKSIDFGQRRMLLLAPDLSTASQKSRGEKQSKAAKRRGGERKP
jgi:hypothetical protein